MAHDHLNGALPDRYNGLTLSQRGEKVAGGKTDVTETSLVIGAPTSDDGEVLISRSSWPLRLSGLLFAGLLVVGRAASGGQIVWLPAYHANPTPLIVVINQPKPGTPATPAAPGGRPQRNRVFRPPGDRVGAGAPPRVKLGSLTFRVPPAARAPPATKPVNPIFRGRPEARVRRARKRANLTYRDRAAARARPARKPGILTCRARPEVLGRPVRKPDPRICRARPGVRARRVPRPAILTCRVRLGVRARRVPKRDTQTYRARRGARARPATR